MTVEQQPVRFLTRAEVEYLAEKLGELPEIEQELAIALTGEAGGRGSGAFTRSQPRSRSPYPIHLEVVRDELKNELVTAVRDIEVTRGIEFDGGNSISGCGHWLTRNRTALQHMDSGVDTFESLCDAVDKATRALGHQRVAPLGAAERSQARDAVVTASTIETVAKRVGAQGLNDRRLRLLAKRGAVRAITTTADGAHLYRLGEVLDAHHDTPRRGA